MARPLVIGLVAFGSGALLTAGGFTAFPSRPSTPQAAPTKEPEPVDENELVKANQNLTEALQACDRRLAELRDAPAPTAAAPSAPPREERDGGRWAERGRRARGEPTKEDWERMAQLGMVRVRIPCIRDKPWTPNQRVMDRLGLAPGDGDIIREAYERSNKRVTEQIKPICAKVLGSAEVVERVGVTACMDAIQSSARKTNAGEAKSALTRAAEVQAGKRPAPAEGADVAALEQLALVLANESKAFESDLAQKLGPDEAKRLANAPEMCSDRRVLRASDDRDDRGAQ